MGLVVLKQLAMISPSEYQGHSLSLLVQVTKKYEESYDSLPSYISNLASPMRKKHQDELIGTKANFG